MIKAESYYNKAFIQLNKQNNQYRIICNAYNMKDCAIIVPTEAESLQIYNNVKLNLSKIINMSMCCFNEEIQKEMLLIDCNEFESKYRTNII